MHRIPWLAVTSAVLALSCGGTAAPSPDPSVAAGAGYLRCDENGRLDVEASGRTWSVQSPTQAPNCGP